MIKKKLQTIEFFQMLIANKFGKPQVFHGALLFSSRYDLVRVLSPYPTLHSLYQAIEALHTSTQLRGKISFLNHTHQQVTAAVQAFCHQGLPLLNIFDESIARIEELTAFQMHCYQNAALIPHGETRSYAWLADKIKKNGAERAVGGALRSNPFPLFIPCHRVVKKNGMIGGFMGSNQPDSWQISVKKALLEIEELHQQPSLFSYSRFEFENTIQ